MLIETSGPRHPAARFRPARFHQLTLVTTLAAALAGMGVTAHAQSAGAKKAADSSGAAPMALEEVIVTAEKREQSLQKVPIAVSAISSRELETLRISNVMDMSNKVPSVNLVPFTGNRSTPNLFIRGMGNLDTQTTKDGATGIYVDGVLISRGTGVAADIADLERVEVLRGPQGTLYGRNTTAGAINFISRKPEKDFSFEQQLTTGSYDLFTSRTKVNIPLAENLYARFAYMRSSNDGWVRNNNSTLPNQADFNQDKKEAMKLAVRLKATDRLTVDYTLDSSKLEDYGNLYYQIVQPNGRQLEAAAVKGLLPSNAKNSGHNLTLTWDLDWAVLKSITAYRKLDSDAFQNYADIFTQTRLEKQDQTSQEFQLVGDAFGQRLKYVAGLFFFKENSDESSSSVYNPTLSDTWAVKASSRSKAIYGQATWKPPVLQDRLQLTLGLRHTSDDREATKTFVASNFSPATNGMVVPADKHFSKLNPSLTADYAFTDDISGYAKIATGYRAGGFNVRSTVVGFGEGFNMENVRAYEIGMKSDLFDKRMRLNLAAFSNRYSNLQVDQARTPPIFTDTLNAGKAEIKGVEVELSALLAEGLMANLFFATLDGKYKSYMDNGVELASQRHMPFTPKNQGGVGLQYTSGMTPYGRLIANLDYKWQDHWFSGPIANTLTPGYGVWNARIQLANIRAAQGMVRVALWSKNLTDRKYRIATTNLGLISTQYGEPRMNGVDLIYEY
ncbi:TonB-dependent receptor [Denitratisoma sp. DHT3]|uniref:TonB-dependent receptor n=1 Tax=Denitratisoma sp. DHT3 TaxID=1981880 RepID=UPI0016454EB7|nr:TonB-dependent receptor [Denitratisoma sp. DHT3]